MKKLLLLLMLVCSVSAWAQDVIVKKDGSTIICRVVEVSQTEVVYKRWTNLEGPNYVMNLSDVSAINFENGEKVRPDAQTTTEATTNPLLQSNNGQQTVSDAMLLAMADKTKPFDPVKAKKKAKKLKLAGWIGGGAMIVAGAIIIGTVKDYHNVFPGSPYQYREVNRAVGAAIGAPMMGAGIALTMGCLIRAHNLNKKINSYTVNTSSLYENEFKLKNGASLATGIDLLKDNKHHNPALGLGLRYNF